MQNLHAQLLAELGQRVAEAAASSAAAEEADLGPRFTCAVCYAEKGSRSRLRLASCAAVGEVCVECFKAHIASALAESYPGVCKPVRCICGEGEAHVVPLQDWEKVGGVLKGKYLSLAASMLSIACGSCHNPSSLQCPQLLNEEAANAALEKLGSQMGEPLMGQLRLFLKNWNHDLYPKKEQFLVLYEAVTIAHGDRKNEIMNQIRGCIYDPERRARFHLMQLKLDPMVSTLCCGRLHCFACKIRDGHSGVTCAQFQAQRSDDDIVTCKTCNMMLVKGDGCSSVYCYCGQYINWDEALTQVRNNKMAEFVENLLRTELSYFSFSEFFQAVTHYLEQPSSTLPHPALTAQHIAAWRATIPSAVADRAIMFRTIAKQTAEKGNSMMSLHAILGVSSLRTSTSMAEEERAYISVTLGKASSNEQAREESHSWLLAHKEAREKAVLMIDVRNEAARKAAKRAKLMAEAKYFQARRERWSHERRKAPRPMPSETSSAST